MRVTLTKEDGSALDDNSKTAVVNDFMNAFWSKSLITLNGNNHTHDIKIIILRHTNSFFTIVGEVTLM